LVTFPVSADRNRSMATTVSGTIAIMLAIPYSFTFWNSYELLAVRPHLPPFLPPSRYLCIIMLYMSTPSLCNNRRGASILRRSSSRRGTSSIRRLGRCGALSTTPSRAASTPPPTSPTTPCSTVRPLPPPPGRSTGSRPNQEFSQYIRREQRELALHNVRVVHVQVPSYKRLLQRKGAGGFLLLDTDQPRGPANLSEVHIAISKRKKDRKKEY
jgi:hypothetical protein